MAAPCKKDPLVQYRRQSCTLGIRTWLNNTPPHFHRKPGVRFSTTVWRSYKVLLPVIISYVCNVPLWEGASSCLLWSHVQLS